MAQADLEVNIRANDRLTPTLKNTQSAIIRFVGAVSASLAALEAITFPINQAREFEEAILQVGKTTGFSTQELEELGNALSTLSTQLPVTATGLANIAAIAGQLGLGQQGSEAVLKFTESVTKATVALDLSEQKAAEAAARIGNVFSIAISETDNLFSVVNALSNTSTANANTLIDIIQRVGNIAGITYQEVAALSAVATDLGVKQEVAGTAFVKLLTKFQTEAPKFAEVIGISVEDFLASSNIDRLKAFLTSVSRLSEEAGAKLTTDLLGAGARNFALIDKLTNDAANGFILLDKHLTTATQAFEEGVSVQQEYEVQASSLNNQLQILGNIFRDLGIDIGNQALPVLKEAVQELQQFAQSADFQDFFKGLGNSLNDFIRGIIDLARAIPELSEVFFTFIKLLELFVGFQIAKLIVAIAGKFTVFITSITRAGTAWTGFGLAVAKAWDYTVKQFTATKAETAALVENTKAVVANTVAKAKNAQVGKQAAASRVIDTGLSSFADAQGKSLFFNPDKKKISGIDKLGIAARKASTGVGALSGAVVRLGGVLLRLFTNPIFLVGSLFIPWEKLGEFLGLTEEKVLQVDDVLRETLEESTRRVRSLASQANKAKEAFTSVKLEIEGVKERLDSLGRAIPSLEGFRDVEILNLQEEIKAGKELNTVFSSLVKQVNDINIIQQGAEATTKQLGDNAEKTRISYNREYDVLEKLKNQYKNLAQTSKGRFEGTERAAELTRQISLQTDKVADLNAQFEENIRLINLAQDEAISYTNRYGYALSQITKLFNGQTNLLVDYEISLKDANKQLEESQKKSERIEAAIDAAKRGSENTINLEEELTEQKTLQASLEQTIKDVNAEKIKFYNTIDKSQKKRIENLKLEGILEDASLETLKDLKKETDKLTGSISDFTKIALANPNKTILDYFKAKDKAEEFELLAEKMKDAAKIAKGVFDNAATAAKSFLEDYVELFDEIERDAESRRIDLKIELDTERFERRLTREMDDIDKRLEKQIAAIEKKRSQGIYYDRTADALIESAKNMAEFGKRNLEVNQSQERAKKSTEQLSEKFRGQVEQLNILTERYEKIKLLLKLGKGEPLPEGFAGFTQEDLALFEKIKTTGIDPLKKEIQALGEETAKTYSQLKNLEFKELDAEGFVVKGLKDATGGVADAKTELDGLYNRFSELLYDTDIGAVALYYKEAAQASESAANEFAKAATELKEATAQFNNLKVVLDLNEFDVNALAAAVARAGDSFDLTKTPTFATLADDVRGAIQQALNSDTEVIVLKRIQEIYAPVKDTVGKAIGEGAIDGASQIQSHLNQLNLKVPVTLVPVNATGAQSNGLNLPVGGNAAGGLIRGPGTATSDSILSRLSNGEFVVNALTTKFFGSDFFYSLQRMARGGGIPKFAAGGLASSKSVVNLTIPGIGTVGPMMADNTVVDNLNRALARQSLKSGGRRK